MVLALGLGRRSKKNGAPRSGERIEKLEFLLPRPTILRTGRRAGVGGVLSGVSS